MIGSEEEWCKNYNRDVSYNVGEKNPEFEDFDLYTYWTLIPHVDKSLEYLATNIGPKRKDILILDSSGNLIFKRTLIYACSVKIKLPPLTKKQRRLLPA